MNENETRTIIGNYHIYVSEAYDALERLQNFMNDPKFQNLVQDKDPKVSNLLEEENVFVQSFKMFLNDLNDAF
jgi:hypothetical protein